jgi:hypothetical protein
MAQSPERNQNKIKKGGVITYLQCHICHLVSSPLRSYSHEVMSSLLKQAAKGE